MPHKEKFMSSNSVNFPSYKRRSESIGGNITGGGLRIKLHNEENAEQSIANKV